MVHHPLYCGKKNPRGNIITAMSRSIQTQLLFTYFFVKNNVRGNKRNRFFFSFSPQGKSNPSLSRIALVATATFGLIRKIRSLTQIMDFGVNARQSRTINLAFLKNKKNLF